MNLVINTQQLQLRLVEAALVNESCASDLLGILRKLSCAEAKCVISIIGLLNHEGEELKRISKNLEWGPGGILTRLQQLARWL